MQHHSIPIVIGIQQLQRTILIMFATLQSAMANPNSAPISQQLEGPFFVNTQSLPRAQGRMHRAHPATARGGIADMLAIPNASFTPDLRTQPVSISQRQLPAPASGVALNSTVERQSNPRAGITQTYPLYETDVEAARNQAEEVMYGTYAPQHSAPTPAQSVNLPVQQNVRNVCRHESRRTLQRQVDTSYAQHKKLNDETLYKVQTDAAGNITTNKLTVTNMIKSLMAIYLDIAQIYYEDNDPRFQLIERYVCQQFVFEPALKKNWMVDYMRTRLEKTRGVYRKHFEETGSKHPECPDAKHPALVAWWASPEGSNRSSRIRVMNTARAQERQSLNLGGMQQRQMHLPRPTSQPLASVLQA